MAPRLFRNISGLFAAALVAASPLPAASSAAAAASGSPTLVQGVADGAVTGGATKVTARVFDYEAPRKPGDPLPEYVVGETTTDSSGHFTLRLNPAAVPARVGKGNNDLLNIELSSTSADGSSGLTVIPRQRTSSGWTMAADPGAAAQVSALAASSPEVRIPVQNASAERTAARAGFAKAALAAGTSSYCSWVFQRYDSRVGKLFDAHSVTKTKITWYYGATASSTTDIGLQYSPTGGYSLSGSFTVSNTQSSEQSASASGSKHSYAATNFRVDTYKLVPDNASASYCTNYGNLPGSKKLVTTAWLSGASWSGTLPTIVCGSSSAYYVPQAAHSTFTKTSSRTEKIGGGISTPVVGLGISSAYTSSVGLTVRYEWTSAGAACGNNAYPPSAQYLYVG